ncbi:surface protein 1 [Xylariaceae sp. FL0594]|nr:surface protein 1 [Xylariaceae sp. FL0594]
MQLSIRTLSTLLAASSTVLGRALSTSADTEWTLRSLSRKCDTADSTCTWVFGIDTGNTTIQNCTYVVKASTSPPAPASQANGGPVTCGIYTVTSGWSGQFGSGKGFTVLSVVDYAKKLIVYAGYTDISVASGATVEPDLSFPVQTLQ